MSVRSPADPPTAGNRVGVMVVPLPVGDDDAGRRLRQIARATAERKRLPPVQPNARILQRWMVRVMSRQRLVNLLTSDLPGPPEPLSLVGAQVLELFQIGVVQGNIALSVGALSYAGQLNLGIVADRDAVPGLAELTGGCRMRWSNWASWPMPEGWPGESGSGHQGAWVRSLTSSRPGRSFPGLARRRRPAHTGTSAGSRRSGGPGPARAGP